MNDGLLLTSKTRAIKWSLQMKMFILKPLQRFQIDGCTWPPVVYSLPAWSAGDRARLEALGQAEALAGEPRRGVASGLTLTQGSAVWVAAETAGGYKVQLFRESLLRYMHAMGLRKFVSASIIHALRHSTPNLVSVTVAL